MFALVTKWGKYKKQIIKWKINFQNLTSDYLNKNLAKYKYLVAFPCHETHNPDHHDYESFYFSECKND